jgi:pimeloyl-ACP methyl ester carboxylesterase
VVKNKSILIFNLLMIMMTHETQAQTVGRYATVNGIKMYYEIHGSGSPLILIHGGGSTINTSFGRILPELAKTHRVIALEMQAHGHTGDRDAPETFIQDAADVVELMRQLDIFKADIMGFSNGGQTTIEIGIKYPEKVHKLIIASAFYRKDGAFSGFWDGFAIAKLTDMPQLYRDEFLKIKNNQAALLNMFNKDVQRMKNFKDWPDDDMRSIQAPVLIVAGDRDVLTTEHAVKMSRVLPHARLAIFPGTHGSYMGEALSADPNSKEPLLFVAVLNDFLAAP